MLETNSSTSCINSIVLIGFQDQGNLGLGYLAAVLRENHYNVIIADVASSDESILHLIKIHKPIIVGFSLIFQYYLPTFKQLASYLRVNDINCHMTIGGHFPSMCFETTLEIINELDSVVRYEGEYTLLELANCLSERKSWQQIDGIAYKDDNNQYINNNLRDLVEDLDTLPTPYRALFNNEILGLKVQPVLASRGCPRKCSFCSIREFYSQAKGKIVRRRSPSMVVQEMRELYEIHDIRIFLFQDDDFPLVGKAGKQWVYEYIEELEKNSLIGKVVWKISCRVDELDRKLFMDMRNAGLYLVYLGIESGSPTGLKTLTKDVSIEDNYRAISLLKELNIMFGYGFMLVDPSSSFESILENTKFLKNIVGDGSAPVVFCKMLPYSGTPIEKELIATHRLTGTIAHPDYNFLDPVLDSYYHKLNETLLPWVSGKDAVSNYLNLMWHEVSIIETAFEGISELDQYTSNLTSLTKQSNEHVLSMIEQSAQRYQTDRLFPFSAKTMELEAREIINRLMALRDSFIRNNQTTILSQLDGVCK